MLLIALDDGLRFALGRRIVTSVESWDWKICHKLCYNVQCIMYKRMWSYKTSWDMILNYNIEEGKLCSSDILFK